MSILEIKVIENKGKIKLVLNNQTPFLTFSNKQEVKDFIKNYVEINNIKEVKIINKDKVEL